MMNTPRSAGMNPLIEKKSKNHATSISIITLMMTTNKPSVKITKGSDKSFKIGLINAFAKPKRAPALSKFRSVISILIPGTIFAAAQIAKALLMTKAAIFKKSFICLNQCHNNIKAN